MKIKLCRTAVSYDKSKWTGVIVVPECFVPPGKQEDGCGLVPDLTWILLRLIFRRLVAGPRYCGNLYSIFGGEGSRKYLSTFPVPGYREQFGHAMHQDVVGDRLHPDMHAFLSFHLLPIPVLPHLCNWSVTNHVLIQDAII